MWMPNRSRNPASSCRLVESASTMAQFIWTYMALSLHTARSPAGRPRSRGDRADPHALHHPTRDQFVAGTNPYWPRNRAGAAEEGVDDDFLSVPLPWPLRAL